MEENKISNSEENIITDENLLKFFTKENLEEMATLFSKGNFSELINKFFLVDSRSDSVNSAQKSDRNPSTASEQANSNNALNNNNINNNNAINNSNSNTNNNANTNTITNIASNQNPQNIMFSNIINSPIITPSPSPSISQKNGEFNYNLFEKLNEDELTQQILLTIVLFCFLKKKVIPEEPKNLINKYNYRHNDMIFPLILLKVKYYIKTKNIPRAIDILNEAIFLYEDYKSHLDEKKNDLKNIYTIETYHQKFKYFDNLFNYLFCMNKLDVKIKKLYFELKSCLNSLKFYSQAYKTILELYQKYPDDILIQFELAKDSVIFSKPDKYQEILQEMEKNRDKQQDENKIKIYNNYIMYAKAMSELAQCKYDETKTIFKDILKNDENNVLIKNNIAVLNVYKNNPKECYDSLITIYHEKKNDSGNEFIRNTIKSIQDKFNLKSK